MTGNLTATLTVAECNPVSAFADAVPHAFGNPTAGGRLPSPEHACAQSWRGY
jgi:hypothetical protein